MSQKKLKMAQQICSKFAQNCSKNLLKIAQNCSKNLLKIVQTCSKMHF